MDVEAVTHALCWIASRGDSQPTHAIILTDLVSLLQKVKSGMGSPDWNMSMVNVHLWKLLWVYCPGHAGMKGNDRADTETGRQSNPHKWLAASRKRSVEKLETLAVGIKAKDITPSIAWRREAWKEEVLDDL